MSEPSNLPERPDDGHGRLAAVNPPLGPGANLRVLPAAHSLAFTEAPQPRADEDEIDLRALWRLLLKRRWLILAIAGAVLAITLVHTLLTPSIYRATATLEISPSTSVVIPGQMNEGQQNYWDPDFQGTQIELLKGRALSQRVAQSLHLVGSNIFEQIRPPSWTQRLGALLGMGGTTPRKAAAAAPSMDRAQPTQPQASAPVASKDQLAELDRMTGLVQGGLTIDPVRGSNLVRVEYNSTSPQFAAEVANALADGFVASTIDRQFGASSYAKQYLGDQLTLLRSRLEDSERKLVAYAQKEDLVPNSSGGSLSGQNLTDLNASLANAQSARIKAQAQWQEVKAASGTALPTDMLNGDPVLGALQQQKAQLMSQYQSNLQTYKPDYPTMQALKKQIDAVQGQIDKRLVGIRASVKAQYDAAVAQENLLQAQLAQLRSQTLNVQDRSIRYNILKRDVDTNRELYNALLQRYKSVSAASGVRPSNITVIDHAEVPKGRYSPSLSRNAGVGLILGLILGVGVAWLLERFDDSIKTPADLEQRLHLAVLGVIPKLVKQSPRDALDDPRSSFSESYRSVRTALQFTTDNGVPNVLLVTSAASGEGKTTTALTLARNFAQLGKHVLLIEGDLRNPSLSKAMGLVATNGMSNLLSGAASMAQAVLPSGEPNLDVILAGAIPPSPTELLAGHKLVSLLMTASQKYDQIIIDGPPVLGLADAPILANAASGTLLVVKARVTRASAAQQALKRLLAARARLVGGLLTHYQATAGDYGYYAYAGYEYYSYGNGPKLGRD